MASVEVESTPAVEISPAPITPESTPPAVIEPAAAAKETPEEIEAPPAVVDLPDSEDSGAIEEKEVEGPVDVAGDVATVGEKAAEETEVKEKAEEEEEEKEEAPPAAEPEPEPTAEGLAAPAELEAAEKNADVAE